MDNEVMPPTQVVIVGCGQMARNHYLPALLADSRVRVVALVDPNQETLTELLWQFPALAGAVTCADVSELLDKIDKGVVAVDAACVLTHPAGREVIVEALMSSGIDVMQEKPFAIGVAAAQHLERHARETGRRLVINHQYQVWTRSASIAPWVAAELAGRATFGRVRWIRRSAPRGGPFADPRHGLQVYDTGTHVLCVELDMAGWPEIVEASPIPMSAREREVHVHQFLTADTGAVIEVRLSDVLATRGGGTSVFWRREHDFELSLRLPTSEPSTEAFVPVVSAHEHGSATTRYIDAQPPTVAQMVARNIKGFVDCIRGERDIADTGLTTAVQGVQLTRVLALVAAAHERGDKVSIDELQ